MNAFITLLGLGMSAGILAALIWSIARPSQRQWPPEEYTIRTHFLVWVPKFTLFGVLVLLGILGWASLPFPDWMRFGIGASLIFTGNAAVWFEDIRFGIAQTGGAVGHLRTDGLYRYSCNPQYVADILIIIGWMLLAATPIVVLVGSAAILVLLAAPFAEEPWLRARFAADFEEYARSAFSLKRSFATTQKLGRYGF